MPRAVPRARAVARCPRQAQDSGESDDTLEPRVVASDLRRGTRKNEKSPTHSRGHGDSAIPLLPFTEDFGHTQVPGTIFKSPGPRFEPQLTMWESNTSNMSFEELLELQSHVGTKTYKQLVAGNSSKKPNSRPSVQSACVSDKHRPLEMSAKVRVPFLRQVVPISKKVARDPRFDDLSGEYNPEVFDKTYQFLNDIRAKEKELVKKQLKKHHSGEKHEKLQQLLQRMEQQEKAEQERKRQQELRLTLKQERRAQAQQGHRPYFLKKSEQRQLTLAEKFKELKRSKKLESFLSRKRRRNAGKDRRHLPLSKE